MKLPVFSGLSVLELSLMVALVKLTETYDGDPVNFEMVYNGEYSSLIFARIKKIRNFSLR